MKLFVILLLVISSTHGTGINNYQTSIQTEKSATERIISKQQKEIMKQARNYKKNLERKREATKQLLHKLKGIEVIMKSNQMKRKKIIKYWNDFYSSQNTIGKKEKQ